MYCVLGIDFDKIIMRKQTRERIEDICIRVQQKLEYVECHKKGCHSSQGGSFGSCLSIYNEL